jgi:hypothetical protein
MAMKKAAPKKSGASDKAKKAQSARMTKQARSSRESGSDRGAKMKAEAAEDAYLRKGSRAFYEDGQMITDMSELKRLQKRLAKRELELKAEAAKMPKRKER